VSIAERLFCLRASLATHSETRKEKKMANTKTVEDVLERKKIKRAARKAAPPKGPRTGARGENKQKLKKAARGQSKRK
jgi:hypothetical protein